MYKIDWERMGTSAFISYHAIHGLVLSGYVLCIKGCVE